MVFIQIIALIIIILAAAWMFRIQFVEAVPVSVSALILLLAGLSFLGGGLRLWDFLAVLLPAAAGVYLWRIPKEKRKEIFLFVKKELTSAGTVTAVALILIVTLCVSGKPVSWWDDYNFWATDAKSLFFLDGFAGRYANVAPEFGDYPPGTQMMKWFFLHFSPNEFREGLMFAGYYFMNLAFLVPYLKYIKKHNVFAMALGGILLWIFPSVAESFWIDGCCADLTMALVYGGFLTAVVDRKGHGEGFYYIRQALYLMVLVLCKNTGFIWVAFGLLFDYGYHVVTDRREPLLKENRKAHRKALLLVTAFPVLAEGIWLAFCVLNRRVAKLTGTAIRMVTGSMNLPDYQETMVKAFAEAFVKWPLHRGNTGAVDLSPLALFLLLLLFVLLLWKFHLIRKGVALYFGVFMVCSGAAFYTFNLLGHLTIFAVETQYLEPFGMISSIERYGAPFMIGGLCLVAYLVLEKGGRKGMLVCALFILLTADHAGAYRGLWGYGGQKGEILSTREEIVDEAAERFLEQVGAGRRGNTGRVLYLRDISDVSWVRNTYIGFEAAPVSVMYGNVDTQSGTAQDILDAATAAHAKFLYVDELSGDGQKLFEPFLQGEKMEYGRLYRLIETAEGTEMRKHDSKFALSF